MSAQLLVSHPPAQVSSLQLIGEVEKHTLTGCAKCFSCVPIIGWIYGKYHSYKKEQALVKLKNIVENTEHDQRDEIYDLAIKILKLEPIKSVRDEPVDPLFARYHEKLRVDHQRKAIKRLQDGDRSIASDLRNPGSRTAEHLRATLENAIYQAEEPVGQKKSELRPMISEELLKDPHECLDRIDGIMPHPEKPEKTVKILGGPLERSILDGTNPKEIFEVAEKLYRQNDLNPHIQMRIVYRLNSLIQARQEYIYRQMNAEGIDDKNEIDKALDLVKGSLKAWMDKFIDA